ncbi:MAG: cell division protein ZapE [Alphaproteobacteria bacterium]
MNGTATQDPIEGYRALLSDGTLRPDPIQELAVEKLQMLAHRLRHYRPEAGGGGLRGLLGLKKKVEPPAGLYFHGGVGRGKSMLMDLFYDAAEVERKRRAHFHGFMLDVHERINAFRRTPPDQRDGDDPIPPVAADLADAAWLLCFDEFEVRDVADAMILGRLFTQLFARGVVVVATSNRAPGELYLGGLNRQLFLPFIALMQQRMDVMHLDGGVDYRLDRLSGHDVYQTPLGPDAERELDEDFERLTDEKTGEPAEVEVKGRKLKVREQAKGVARFTFEELCARPLGAVDYLALCRAYHTLIISGIPKLGPAKRNEARRLVLLIDVMYDHGTKLICSAEAAPDQLYTEGDGAFEFARTVSRLMEMQADDYVTAPHETGG